VSNDYVGLPAEAIPKPLASVLAPLDRRAFGVAVGAVCGLGLLLLTAADLLRRPQPGLNLALLGQYFPGYAVSWAGAFVGLVWAFVLGFCAGWLLAFFRNLGIAAWILVVRARHEIAATRDFLDHI
jgi:hypothetical protein